MTPQDINRETIAETYQAIRSYIRRTPTVEISAADLGLPVTNPIILKLELLQHAGSFKPRGAFSNLLLRDVPTAGVAAASGGNHGAAVAYAAQQLGHKATIFVPEIASPAKISRIRDYGAELVIAGAHYADALERCAAFVEAEGAMELHAYDQPETLVGQGTLGLELETQAPNFTTLLVAVGGGGLIGGLAAWLQDRSAIVGVEPKTSCALHAALEAGNPVDVEVSGISADSLGARRAGHLAFALAQTFVEQVALVDDDAIRQAQSLLWDQLRLIAEPGGAAALAALTSGAYVPRPEERLCVVICGGNTTAVDFTR
ncbi:MAG TPA: threonine/serine dehydratase [Hyphomicrobiaceae bacterium]|nr:threonine/serine dehydratase [Hyphomicrobiaceae bacterium]